MKYIVLIFLVCSGIINDVFAQRKLPVNKNGETINSQSYLSSKDIEIAQIASLYKPDTKPKPKPVIHADATLFYESFDNVYGYMNHGNGTYNFPEGWLRFNADAQTPHGNVGFQNEAWVRAPDFLFSVTD